jgi:hypothetical protein
LKIDKDRKRILARKDRSKALEKDKVYLRSFPFSFQGQAQGGRVGAISHFCHGPLLKCSTTFIRYARVTRCFNGED